MSEKITILTAIIIIFLFWYFFLGGNVIIKTSIDHTKLAPVEKMIEIPGIIPPADTQSEGEIETPLVLYVVSEGMNNGISIENDGTVIFTLNTVELTYASNQKETVEIYFPPPG